MPDSQTIPAVLAGGQELFRPLAAELAVQKAVSQIRLFGAVVGRRGDVLSILSGYVPASCKARITGQSGLRMILRGDPPAGAKEHKWFCAQFHI